MENRTYNVSYLSSANSFPSSAATNGQILI